MVKTYVYEEISIWANPIGCGDRTYFQINEKAVLTIGNNCGISNTAITCEEKVTIEDNVMIGSGCHIYDTDFHPLEYSERVKEYYKGCPTKRKPVRICEGAFIGAGCYILKGCNRCGKSLCALLAQHQIRNDLCALLTGKYVLGVELTVGTLEDAQRCQKVDCLEMCDLVVIAVILDVHRAGGDHKAQYHSERKNECKVTLQKFHVCVLLIFYFCART